MRKAIFGFSIVLLSLGSSSFAEGSFENGFLIVSGMFEIVLSSFSRSRLGGGLLFELAGLIGR